MLRSTLILAICLISVVSVSADDPLPAGAMVQLGTSRLRHGIFLKCLAFGKDATSIVSVIESATDGVPPIIIWDTSTGCRLREISPENLYVRDGAMSADGTMIAVVGTYYEKEDEPTQGFAVLIDPATGKQLHRIKLGDAVSEPTAALAPDGKTLATLIGNEGIIRLWDTVTGKQISELKHKLQYRPKLSFSPDGKRLAINALTNFWYLWDWKTQKEPVQYGTSRTGVRDLSFSPDGKLIALATEDDGVGIFEVATETILKAIQAERSNYRISARFTPDGRHLLISTDRPAQLTRVFDARTFELLARIERSGELHDVSSDSKWMLSQSSNCAIRIWDLKTRVPLHHEHEAHLGAVTSVAFGADDRLSTAGNDSLICWWDVAHAKVLRQFEVGPFGSVATSPKGDRIAALDLSNHLSIWDAQSGKRLFILPGHGNVGSQPSIAFSTDGKSIITSGTDRTIRRSDPETGKTQNEFPIKPRGVTLPDLSGPNGIAQMVRGAGGSVMSPGGAFFLTTSGDLGFVFDTSTGKQSGMYTLAGGTLRQALSPDGRQVATIQMGRGRQVKLKNGGTRHIGSDEQTLVLLNAETGKPIKTMNMPAGGAVSLEFAPNGRYFAVNCQKRREILILDTLTGNELHKLEEVPAGVTCLAFSASGKLLAAGNYDSTVLVWDVSKLAK